MILYAIVTFVVLFALWIISGYLPTRNIESPVYSVIEAKSGYEIRQYGTYAVAETYQKGSRKEAQSGGFRELFQYISGNNLTRSKITATAPVVQSTAAGGQKISMSAPVIKQGEGDAGRIAFVMPAGSKLEDLPQPRSTIINLRAIPPTRVAAITFSGYASAELIRTNTEKLLAALKRDGRQVHSAPQIALYNPPWTPPFMRRNEVMVAIDQVEPVTPVQPTR